MLRNGILQDSFGVLSFLRLIGLRLDGRMLEKSRTLNYIPYLLCLMHSKFPVLYFSAKWKKK